MSYLTRRDGRYFYRRRFPVEVEALVGRKEFRKALGTADRKEAEKAARIVSVEFDRVCADALAKLPKQSVGECPVVVGEFTAEQILERIRSVVDMVTRGAIEALDSRNRICPTWAEELQWQKQALLAVSEGKHPASAQYNPVEAMAAYRALEALERGEVPLGAYQQPVGSAGTATRSADSDSRTAAEFDEVLEGYCSRVRGSRAGIVRSLAKQILRWPSTQAEQVQRLMQYAASKLAGGMKESSAHTQVSGLITVLRELPGWEKISIPRNGSTARAVRKGGQLQANARHPMPLHIVREVVTALDTRGDAVDAAAARLLVRYGLRPVELLQEGPEALAHRVDILGHGELVYHAGLSGAKNSASRRCLPVHPDDIPLFESPLVS